jgi:hypothetical protein
MTQLYRATGGFWRHNVSLAILVIVGIYGVWESWRLATYGATTEWDWVFAVGFVAGSIYGFRQLLQDTRDRVVTLHRDEAAGTLVAALWRPFRVERVVAAPGEIGNWRVYATVRGRNSQTLFIYADASGYPRPLQFELGDKIDREGLRSLTPETVAEFERRVGLTPAA